MESDNMSDEKKKNVVANSWIVPSSFKQKETDHDGVDTVLSIPAAYDLVDKVFGDKFLAAKETVRPGNHFNVVSLDHDIVKAMTRKEVSIESYCKKRKRDDDDVNNNNNGVDIVVIKHRHGESVDEANNSSRKKHKGAVYDNDIVVPKKRYSKSFRKTMRKKAADIIKQKYRKAFDKEYHKLLRKHDARTRHKQDYHHGCKSQDRKQMRKEIRKQRREAIRRASTTKSKRIIQKPLNSVNINDA